MKDGSPLAFDCNAIAQAEDLVKKETVLFLHLTEEQFRGSGAKPFAKKSLWKFQMRQSTLMIHG
jgi:hypothetical protein